jgi:hypothetical protein
MYGENSVRRGEFTLYAPHVPRQKLIIANDCGNFIQISYNPKKINEIDKK